MRPVPVTNGTVEAGMPIEGEEEHGTIVIVAEDVNDGVDHATEDEGQAPMSMRADFVYEAPKQNGVNAECRWRVQEVMACDPIRIIEVQVIEGFVHYAFHGLCREITRVKKVAN